MAAMVPASPSAAQSAAVPRGIDRGSNLRITTPQTPMLQSLRSGQLTLDTFSPVNQNGSFEFDRVIKSGEVMKRTRRTKSWKTIYIVLRPNLISIYRDKQETKLRHQITLSDLTAVARQKDPKGKAQHVFALFSPARNYHLATNSDKEVQEWVELVRREARIDRHEEEMIVKSPGGQPHTFRGFERFLDGPVTSPDDRHTGYSSSDAEQAATARSNKQHPQTMHSSARRLSHSYDYSGPEHGSYSDFSDGVAARMSALSLSLPTAQTNPTQPSESSQGVYGASPRLPLGPRNISQMSGLDLQEQRQPNKQDEERVICHGWVYLLKSKSGVRQWKKLWMVLRPKSLAMYKNEEEYSAFLVISFPHIIDAVDIDPISRSKQYCLQIITEERNYRICVQDDDVLAKWLGSFKSLLVKRKEAQAQRAALSNVHQ